MGKKEPEEFKKEIKKLTKVEKEEEKKSKITEKLQKGLEEKTILELLDSWLENKEYYLKIPPKLKDKISKEDIRYVLSLVKPKGNVVLPKDFDELRHEMLQRVKTRTELKSIKKSEELISRQVQIQEETKNIQNKQTEIINRQNWFILASVIVAILALSVNSYVSYKEVQLMKKQHELIEAQLNSISPLKPTIEVSLDFPEDKKFAVWEIARKITYQDGNEDFNRAKVRFILSNIGRMRTGVVNVFLENSFIHSSRSNDIDNIVGESSEFLEFRLWYNKCYRDIELHELENGTQVQKYVVPSECDYKVSEIPLGWHKFNLTLDCPLCSEEQVKVIPFYFCIFGVTENTSEVCDQPPPK